MGYYDKRAKTCEAVHEAIRALQTAFGEQVLPAWADASPEDRAATLNMVNEIHRTPGITPEKIWSAWAANKVANGWVYGEVKDTGAKTHPCLVDDYSKLSEAQKAKDYVVHAIVRTMFGEQHG